MTPHRTRAGASIAHPPEDSLAYALACWYGQAPRHSSSVRTRTSCPHRTYWACSASTPCSWTLRATCKPSWTSLTAALMTRAQQRRAPTPRPRCLPGPRSPSVCSVPGAVHAAVQYRLLKPFSVRAHACARALCVHSTAVLSRQFVLRFPESWKFFILPMHACTHAYTCECAQLAHAHM